MFRGTAKRVPSTWGVVAPAIAIPSLAIVAIAAIAGVGVAFSPATLAPVLGITTLAAFLFAIVRLAGSAPTVVTADNDALVVGSKRYPRSSVRNAYLVPRDGTAHVRFEGGFAPTLSVANAEVGETLLCALGFDASHIKARFGLLRPWPDGKLHRPTMSLLYAAVAIAIGYGALVQFHRFAGPAVLVLLAVLAALRWMTTRTVEVGADGVMLVKERRFVRIRDIDDVTLDPDRVTLKLRDQTTIELPSRDDATSVALAHRIREARKAWESRSVEDPGAVLRRGGRSIREWVAALRTLDIANLATRAVIETERLWELLESPAVGRETRAAAAVALATNPKNTDRVRVVADAVVEPKLRVAIEAAANGDDDELENVLEQMKAKKEG